MSLNPVLVENIFQRSLLKKTLIDRHQPTRNNQDLSLFMITDQEFIEKVISRINEELGLSLGEISAFKIYQKEKFYFSEIYKIRLTFSKGLKNVVCKRYVDNELFKAERSVKKEYDILQYLHSKFSSIQGINVIKPITILAEDNVLVSEDFSGIKLNKLVVDHIRWVPSKQKKEQLMEKVKACGRWLKYFHKFTKKSETEILSYHRFIKSIEKLLLSSREYGLTQDMQENIYEFIKNKFSIIEVKELDVVGHHQDFNSWNIIAAENEIRVLDFDRFSYSNKYEDYTLFLCTLESMKSILGMNHRNITLLQQAFMKGYGNGNIDSDVLDLYTLKNMLKALTMILSDISADNFLGMVYEKYRKKRQIRNYLNVLSTFKRNPKYD